MRTLAIGLLLVAASGAVAAARWPAGGPGAGGPLIAGPVPSPIAAATLTPAAPPVAPPSEGGLPAVVVTVDPSWTG